MPPDHHDPSDEREDDIAPPDRSPSEAARPVNAAPGAAQRADGAPGHSADADPVTQWATEHYGFPDAPPTPNNAPPSVSGAPATVPRRRRSVLVAAGVLGLVL